MPNFHGQRRNKRFGVGCKHSRRSATIDEVRMRAGLYFDAPQELMSVISNTALSQKPGVPAIERRSANVSGAARMMAIDVALYGEDYAKHVAGLRQLENLARSNASEAKALMKFKMLHVGRE